MPSPHLAIRAYNAKFSIFKINVKKIAFGNKEHYTILWISLNSKRIIYKPSSISLKLGKMYVGALCRGDMKNRGNGPFFATVKPLHTYRCCTLNKSYIYFEYCICEINMNVAQNRSYHLQFSKMATAVMARVPVPAQTRAIGIFHKTDSIFFALVIRHYTAKCPRTYVHGTHILHDNAPAHHSAIVIEETHV